MIALIALLASATATVTVTATIESTATVTVDGDYALLTTNDPDAVAFVGDIDLSVTRGEWVCLAAPKPPTERWASWVRLRRLT